MRLTFLFICISIISFAQPEASANTRADVGTLLAHYKRAGGVTEEMREHFPINFLFGAEYVSFLGTKSVHFNTNDLSSRGIHIGSEIKGIVSIRYPLASLENIFSEPSFSMVQLSDKVRPLLDKVVIGTRADSVWWGIGLPESYTGKDVLIGITDWGFDYTSPMFYDTLLQNTRILAAWDQYKTSGPAPATYGYGTEFSNPTSLQNAGSDTSNIYSYHTHGSHVAGICGGSGAGKPYRGIAFECQYLFTTFLVDEAAVLDAWEWMYNKANAEGKRLVVNMSWGLYHFDAIDGTALISQALDAYSDLGVVFVTSAGNNGDVNFHLKKEYTADTLRTRLSFYVNPALPTVWGQSIHMWGEAGNSFDAALEVYDNSNQLLVSSPFYSTLTTSTYIDSFLVTPATDTIWYNLSADNTYPTNGRPQMRLRVKFPPSGNRIVLASTAPTGTVHYWNVTELTNDVGNWGMGFINFNAGSVAGDNKYGIGTPACTHSAIAIAAYSSEFLSPSGTVVGGAEASFSSLGPLITDSLKPDVAAPGVNVASSISSFTDASYSPVTSVDFNGRTYPFARFSGTSMSSPATAGVAALILDANPYLSAQQVKSILITTARQDSYTGVIPPHSAKWGWGKVNAYAAVKLALITTGINEIAHPLSWNVYPNPVDQILHIQYMEKAPEEMSVVDMNGRTVISGPYSENVDVQILQEGSYFMRLIVDGKVEQQRFVKH
ncbi:MAG: hypothetical protein A3D92_11550 [Bacteroidetes bacterium RIFCSPHIGHO2_02_FULL_44_7]|nr:MAG: hypothetical protein A3D92_11550 [Bacteroidetes bacterium RIFCSPHIGHO2_02_FULL_44_7]